MTAQLHEKLILEDGAEKSMNFCPPLPESHPQLIELTAAEIENDITGSIVFSTACWRRYVGTWEIRDGYLYLAGIVGLYRIVGNEPILADWFTGVLRFVDGKILRYVHMGFGSVYEYEVQIKFERGRQIDSRVIDNRGKQVNEHELTMRNLPGSENSFEGDDTW